MSAAPGVDSNAVHPASSSPGAGVSFSSSSSEAAAPSTLPLSAAAGAGRVLRLHFEPEEQKTQDEVKAYSPRTRSRVSFSKSLRFAADDDVAPAAAGAHATAAAVPVPSPSSSSSAASSSSSALVAGESLNARVQPVIPFPRVPRPPTTLMQKVTQLMQRGQIFTKYSHSLGAPQPAFVFFSATDPHEFVEQSAPADGDASGDTAAASAHAAPVDAARVLETDVSIGCLYWNCEPSALEEEVAHAAAVEAAANAADKATNKRSGLSAGSDGPASLLPPPSAPRTHAKYARSRLRCVPLVSVLEVRVGVERDAAAEAQARRPVENMDPWAALSTPAAGKWQAKQGSNSSSKRGSSKRGSTELPLSPVPSSDLEQQQLPLPAQYAADEDTAFDPSAPPPQRPGFPSHALSQSFARWTLQPWLNVDSYRASQRRRRARRQARRRAQRNRMLEGGGGRGGASVDDAPVSSDTESDGEDDENSGDEDEEEDALRSYRVEPPPLDRCLSIITMERTLDLVAPDRATRDAWAYGLRALTRRADAYFNSRVGLPPAASAHAVSMKALDALGDTKARIARANARRQAASFWQRTMEFLFSRKVDNTMHGDIAAATVAAPAIGETPHHAKENGTELVPSSASHSRIKDSLTPSEGDKDVEARAGDDVPVVLSPVLLPSVAASTFEFGRVARARSRGMSASSASSGSRNSRNRGGEKHSSSSFASPPVAGCELIISCRHLFSRAGVPTAIANMSACVFVYGVPTRASAYAHADALAAARSVAANSSTAAQAREAMAATQEWMELKGVGLGSGERVVFLGRTEMLDPTQCLNTLKRRRQERSLAEPVGGVSSPSPSPRALSSPGAGGGRWTLDPTDPNFDTRVLLRQMDEYASFLFVVHDAAGTAEAAAAEARAAEEAASAREAHQDASSNAITSPLPSGSRMQARRNSIRSLVSAESSSSALPSSAPPDPQSLPLSVLQRSPVLGWTRLSFDEVTFNLGREVVSLLSTPGSGAAAMGAPSLPDHFVPPPPPAGVALNEVAPESYSDALVPLESISNGLLPASPSDGSSAFGSSSFSYARDAEGRCIVSDAMLDAYKASVLERHARAEAQERAEKLEAAAEAAEREIGAVSSGINGFDGLASQSLEIARARSDSLSSRSDALAITSPTGGASLTRGAPSQLTLLPSLSYSFTRVSPLLLVQLVPVSLHMTLARAPDGSFLTRSEFDAQALRGRAQRAAHHVRQRSSGADELYDELEDQEDDEGNSAVGSLRSRPTPRQVRHDARRRRVRSSSLSALPPQRAALAASSSSLLLLSPSSSSSSSLPAPLLPRRRRHSWCVSDARSLGRMERVLVPRVFDAALTAEERLLSGETREPASHDAIGGAAESTRVGGNDSVSLSESERSHSRAHSSTQHSHASSFALSAHAAANAFGKSAPPVPARVCIDDVEIDVEDDDNQDELEA